MIFNENLAKFAESYLRKGSKVYIEGALQTRKFHRPVVAARRNTTTEIVLQKFRGELTMLELRKGDGGGAGGIPRGGRLRRLLQRSA